jgi:diguanylate cyclase
MSQDELHSIWRYSHKVFELLEEYNIPPTPENYTVWFRHYSGRYPELSTEISHRIEHGIPFDTMFNKYLYRHYASVPEEENDKERLLSDTQDILSDALSIITSIIDEANNKNSTIQQKLDTIIEGDSKDVGSVLAALVTVAKEMKRSSTEMRETLEESQREVEGLKASLDIVTKEAQRDFLTGVYNRKALDKKMTELMQESVTLETPLSMLLIDIDHFKGFNDNFGHLIGDEVLKMVSKILTDMVKGQDIVARFGGEEFIVLLPCTLIGGAMAVAENIRSSIAKKELRHRSAGTSFGSVTVSIGVSSYRRGETIDSWTARTDEALYRSKNAGRNRVTQERLTVDEKNNGI